MTQAERAWADRRQRQLIRQADAISRESAREEDLPRFLRAWSERRRETLIDEANFLRGWLGLPLVPSAMRTVAVDTAA